MKKDVVSLKQLANALKNWGCLAFLFPLVGCVGQTPNMARMMFPDSEIGGTISKSGKINNNASYDATRNTYELGIYSGTLPRIGVELGLSGLTGRIGVASRNIFGTNAWASCGLPWSKEITGGVAISEKISLGHRWAIGTYQYLSHSSEYPMYEDELIKSNETFDEVGLGILLRTMQYRSAIYSLEGKVSRDIDENTYRFSFKANFSLNRKALN